MGGQDHRSCLCFAEITWRSELRALVLMTSLALFLSEFVAEAGDAIPMRTHDAAAARSHTAITSFMMGPRGFEVRCNTVTNLNESVLSRGTGHRWKVRSRLGCGWGPEVWAHMWDVANSRQKLKPCRRDPIPDLLGAFRRPLAPQETTPTHSLNPTFTVSSCKMCRPHGMHFSCLLSNTQRRCLWYWL